MTVDCLILGGGVIGLSIAYELAGNGMRVRVVDRQEPARAASWAGAGILPAAALRKDDPLEQQLAGLSLQTHARWAEQLREASGIDTGFRRCGGLHLALDAAEADALANQQQAWTEAGVDVQPLGTAALRSMEPALAVDAIHAACRTPGECQLRNPRHLKALLVACRQRGVDITPGVEAVDFEVTGDRIHGVRTTGETLRAENYCLATGSWAAMLAGRLGCRAAVRPVRGQMVLLRTQAPPVSQVINRGLRYLVPRDDGRLLVGATMEEAGFATQTTTSGVAGLLQLAMQLTPSLADATIERTWAGLRPGTADGLPYLGRLPEVENGFLAAGHFRSGLFLSAGTALVMSELIRGETPRIDLTPFRPNR